MFYTAEATIDLEAIRTNLRQIVELTDAVVMSVVKADAYGHGLVPAAKAALEGGATWLGTAQLCEALELRRQGVTAPILAWLFTPESSLLEECVSLGVDLSAPDIWAIEAISTAGKKAGEKPRIHLEVDTGMGRGGVQLPEFAEVVEAARQAEASGAVDVVGVWTHLACADEPGHESISAQYRAFGEAIDIVDAAGIQVQLRHIANSAAVVTGLPAYDLVRVGLICYGLSPIETSSTDLGLTPALRLTAELATVKSVEAGSGISYGHTFTAEHETTIGVVPLGYGDGIPRHASNRMTVSVAGRRVRIVGRMCMDQFMVDLGDLNVSAGERVVLIGDPARGEPTTTEWAQATGTVNYEIVTRLGARIPRRYVNELPSNSSNLASAKETE